MSKKLAIKILTASDLTLFEWHFRNRSAGNQKALNLNADVFVKDLYPALPETQEAATGRLPVDLYLYGPGIAGEVNLQRKIIKHGSYKNWRLDGEFIFNPPGEPDRFNVLQPEDVAIIEFTGDVSPSAVRIVLVSKLTTADQSLHAAVTAWLNGRSMASISEEGLHNIVGTTQLGANHPVYELLIDADLEDAVEGGADGIARLLGRRSGGRISKRQLLDARGRADVVGELGESLVADYLEMLRGTGQVDDYEWTSRENAIAPFDFVVTIRGEDQLVDVKSTTGGFDRKVHVSLSELVCMVKESRKYRLYRVYRMSGERACLRVSSDMKGVAEEILRILGTLPSGTTVDSVSLDPKLLDCRDEILLGASPAGSGEGNAPTESGCG